MLIFWTNVAYYLEIPCIGSHQEVFNKRGTLKKLQYLQENTCATVSFWIKFQASGLQLPLKKKRLCELCEIFKCTFFTGYLFNRAPLYDCAWPWKSSKWFRVNLTANLLSLVKWNTESATPFMPGVVSQNLT